MHPPLPDDRLVYCRQLRSRSVGRLLPISRPGSADSCTSKRTTPLPPARNESSAQKPASAQIGGGPVTGGRRISDSDIRADPATRTALCKTDGYIRGSSQRLARRFVPDQRNCCWWSRDLRRKASLPSEADVLSVIAGTLTQAATAARWEPHGIGAHELAMHLPATSPAVKAAGNLSDYKPSVALPRRRGRMALAI